MQNGKAKANYRNNLRAANELNVKLQAELQATRQELVRACSLLAATLEEFHGGKVDLNLGKAIAWLRQRSMPIAYREFKEFGILRVETRRTNVQGQPAVALTQHGLAVPAEPEEQPPDDPTTICNGTWHRDPNAMGVMCPECGGKAKVAHEAV